MAEHSRCQPGRPGPQGLGQVGSPGFAPFQRAKSCTSSLSGSMPSPAAHVFEPLVRELAVAREAAHAEVHAAVAGRIRVLRGDETLDHRDHVVDVLGGARLVGRAEALQPRDVLREGADLALGERRRREALLRRALDDLVVDVGEVADEA